MNSINVHNHFTCCQSAGQWNIRQVPKVFRLALAAI
jgi:hypothetical protein